MSQHTPHPAIHRDPAIPGEWFDGLPGERMRIRVHSMNVGGRLTVIESVAQPMAGPPLHRHPQDEIFFVMFGCLTFQCGTELIVAPSGTVVIARAGTPHAWCNFGRLPARMMVSFTPGGMEEVFEGLASVAPIDLTAYAAKHDMEVLGPPLVPGNSTTLP